MAVEKSFSRKGRSSCRIETMGGGMVVSPQGTRKARFKGLRLPFGRLDSLTEAFLVPPGVYG
jgi:hypothetical protein